MTQRKTKKLLTAAVGVATVSYVVACGRTSPDSQRDGRPVASTDPSSTTQGMPPGPGTISGNLVAPPVVEPPPPPPNTGVISGNLVAPPVVEPPPPMPVDTGIISGNLVAPPYPTETVDPDVTTTPSQTEDVTSGLIAGNLLPPPDFTDTSEPQTTTEPSTTTPPVDEPDAQSPKVDAGVDAGSGQ